MVLKDYTEVKSPRLDSIKLDNKQAKESIYLKATEKYSAEAFVEGFGNKTEFDWAVVPESTDIQAGGDTEDAPEALYTLVKKQVDNTVTIQAPKKEGAYRLFLYAKNEEKKVAYANIPFYVVPNPDATTGSVQLKKRTLNPVYE